MIYGAPYTNANGLLIRPGAVLSDDGRYRYSLIREWWKASETPCWICFIGLNPSTADAFKDDPTIRRELGFAQMLGANALIKVNLASYRATDPKELLRYGTSFGIAAARGPENEWYIAEAVNQARGGIGRGVFAAWGAVPTLFEPDDAFLAKLGRPIMCLGTTGSGAPRHTLYLSKSSVPTEWRA